MNNRPQRKVGQANDIAQLRAELAQSIAALSGDSFKSVRDKLTENLKQVDIIIEKNKQIEQQKQATLAELARVNNEIATVEQQSQQLNVVGNSINKGLSQLKDKLRM